METHFDNVFDPNLWPEATGHPHDYLKTTRSLIAPYERVWGSEGHCRLRAALDGQSSSILTVTGGSSTVGHDLFPGEDHWFAALTKKMNHPRRTFRNAARAAVNSLHAANNMDHLVGDADVLFWEFAINDMWLMKATHMREWMELFIRRAEALPRKPALVFVYLYDRVTTEDGPEYKYGDFFSSALIYQHEVLERFAKAGFDILVIPTGPTLRSIHMEKDIRRWHPSPRGHEAIANLVEQELRRATERRDNCPAKFHQQDLTYPPAGHDFQASRWKEIIFDRRPKSLVAGGNTFGKSDVEASLCHVSGMYCWDSPMSYIGDKAVWSVPACLSGNWLSFHVKGGAKYVGFALAVGPTAATPSGDPHRYKGPLTFAVNDVAPVTRVCPTEPWYGVSGLDMVFSVDKFKANVKGLAKSQDRRVSLCLPAGGTAVVDGAINFFL